MLIIEDLHRVVKFIKRAPRDFPGSRTFVVDDARDGHIHHLVPARFGPKTPVNILTVHEEALVQQPDFRDNLSPNHQKRPHNTVHFGNLVFRQVSQIIRGKPAFGKQEGQTKKNSPIW